MISVNGRHFSTGHRILGSLTSALDAKYAQMTYGEHYRKKVEAALERERQRCADVLIEQKKKASEQKKLTSTMKTPVSSRFGIRPRPRYDLKELRHHQRRCAALLFRAREQGAHKLPVLVQWAPKRRESYYLMSERVYNDRVLMKMRADAGDSPLNFDFANTDGETDNLHDFQELVTKTSEEIKGLSFDIDTKFKDYDYDFSENEEGNQQMTYDKDRNGTEEEVERGNGEKGRRKVVFSDHVTESDTDAIDAKSLARSKRRGQTQLNKGLDSSDIDLSIDSGDEVLDGEYDSADEQSADSPGLRLKDSNKSNRSRKSRRRLSSPDLLSLLHGNSGDEYSSDFMSDDDSEAKQSCDEGGIRPTENGKKDPTGKRLHRNKHCKHTLKQKAQDYFNKLPKLLKTAELRAKLPAKSRETKIDKIGSEVDHTCMEQHKMAYDRALALARFRSLPFSYSLLSREINRMNSFSYFSYLPGNEKPPEDEEKGENKLPKKKQAQPSRSGREAIFGDIDMDDFYNKEDELVYYVKSEELKNVVASTTTGDESSRVEDDISSRSGTTYTSRSNTVKPYSTLGSENEF